MEFEVLDPKEAWQKIQAGALLLDCRTPQEVSEGGFDQALNIPYSEVEARLGEIGEAKDRPIIAFCAVGARSEVARQLLLKHGYRSVWNAGGFQELSRYAREHGLLS